MTTASTPTAAKAAARPRWPYAGPAQKTLLLAGVLVILGSFLPWVSTPLGNLSGMAGAGLWTLSAGTLGLAGSFLRWRRVVAVHALAAGACAVGLSVWQVARVLQISVATHAWGVVVPGTGLLLVLAGGVLALHAGWRLRTGP